MGRTTIFLPATGWEQDVSDLIQVHRLTISTCETAGLVSDE